MNKIKITDEILDANAQQFNVYNYYLLDGREKGWRIERLAIIKYSSGKYYTVDRYRHFPRFEEMALVDSITDLENEFKKLYNSKKQFRNLIIPDVSSSNFRN